MFSTILIKVKPMKAYSYDPQKRFIIHNFSSTPPFSSFLPGIAGEMGIPMWVFYVNRGQAITSFGIESKDSPIMEFLPANKAYQNTNITGFRTFLKLRGSNLDLTYEPFSPWFSTGSTQQMFIGMNELELREENSELGLETSVLYFTIPGENYAGLARSVTFKNTGRDPIDLEILDGMPAVVPYGVNNFLLKELGRTIEAWMEVINLEQDLPFYRVRASVEDKPEVETFESGHFALAFIQGHRQTALLKAFVDPGVIFGQNSCLSTPSGFYQASLREISQVHQIVCGKTPCAFFGCEARLAPSEAITIDSIYGHMHDVAALNRQFQDWLSADYLKTKNYEARKLASELTDVISTQTSKPLFDGYCRQTFLDNVLRGGWPITLGKGKTPYHIYSRKHGDPERDYNAFFLAAEYYSQGNGNYRDVNQNRRCDVFFNPDIGATNIHNFMTLIQADGYNPLVVQGYKFSIPDHIHDALLPMVNYHPIVKRMLSQPFTPGVLIKAIADHQIDVRVPLQEFLDSVIEQADLHFEADFGEGYWTDHWTYNLDLIESTLAIYPDRKSHLLFEEKTLPFYDSAACVNPRAVKYCLTPEGPRQLNALTEVAEKTALIASRESSPHLVRTGNGHGEIYRTSLFAKLVILAVIKFTTLDPWGMGIEMEAGKPGWYDAMNGLPALFGSTMPETYELKRLLKFLLKAIRERGVFDIALPVEVHELLEVTTVQLDIYNGSSDPDRDIIYWDSVVSAREAYRDRIRLGFDGAEHVIGSATLASHFGAFLGKVETGIQRALEFNDGIPPTYFSYQVTAYERIHERDGTDQTGGEFPHFKATRFKPVLLPLFLEGVVRAMKTASPETAAELFQRVRTSDLFDRKLKMYKVNASLEDQPYHIGRARAFTPGWLENESIWLHMEYKYLLEVLNAGLYEEFIADFKSTLIPFQEPEIYKRSPLENSSFLVSSAHPDESLHGAGFVARLSGSTAEFLSIWNLMMVGKHPFTLKCGELCLQFSPTLPGWLFTEEGRITYKFLGRCLVTYHNPGKMDICGGRPHPNRFRLCTEDGQIKEIHANHIPAPYAEEVRTGLITRIDVFFNTERTIQ
jgi:hypothetical protein